MPALYELTTYSQVRTTAESTFVPDDAANRARRNYNAWVTLGGVPDAGPAPTLANYQAAAETQVRTEAAAERAQHFARSADAAGQELIDAMTFREAELADVDGGIDPGEYPLLEALIDIKGVDVAAVATQVLADRLTLATSLGAIEDVLQTALDAIANAADNDDVDTALAAVVWP